MAYTSKISLAGQVCPWDDSVVFPVIFNQAGRLLLDALTQDTAITLIEQSCLHTVYLQTFGVKNYFVILT